MTDLGAHWQGLCHRLNISADLCATGWDVLQSRYGEPHRHYHSLNHIEAVVADFERLRERFDTPESVLLALFFHDIVYDPARQDNEAQSAALMRDLLSEAIDATVLKHASECIWASQGHKATGDADTDLFLDIDMAILGAAWPDYLSYAKGVAREYLPVYGLQAYAAGRCALFLTPTLAHERIFLTDDFADRESQARDNLAAELALWQSGTFTIIDV